MNKKEQKVKEANDKQKVEDTKTDRSIEKTNKKDNKAKENNNSILDTQANKIGNGKKENLNNKNLVNNNNKPKDNNKKYTEPSITQEDQNNANAFLEYIDESGLPEAFQLIFAELISKKINPQNYYSYVGMRLRQIGKELNDLKNN